MRRERWETKVLWARPVGIGGLHRQKSMLQVLLAAGKVDMARRNICPRRQEDGDMNWTWATDLTVTGRH